MTTEKMTDRYEKIRQALAMGPTPGPWAAGKNNLAVNFRFVTDRRGNVIAYCDKSKNEALANASFIAACEPDTAQALLDERDALRAALVRILENEAPDRKAAEEFGGYVLDDELREEARAAIAKATVEDSRQ